MSVLAPAIESRAEEIMTRWVERLREGIAPTGKTGHELRDHVPILVRELVHALRTKRVPARSDAAEEHGRQRFRIGFELDAIVRECDALQTVILDVIEEQGLDVSLPELRLLTSFISNAIAEGVREHARQREAEVLGFRSLIEAARDEAEASRAKLESLFAQAPVAIGIHEGPGHTYTFANPAYRAFVGGRDVVGKTLFDALPEMAGQGFDQLFDQVKASGEPFVAEARPATLVRDGKPTVLWFTFVFAPKRNSAGEIDGIMQCAVDVTAQVEARRQAEGTLQRQAEFEQQLIGIVSHDLRNPLNVIALSSTLLKRDETLAPRSVQFVVRIQNAVERAVRMVGDLLDFTQARLGGGIAVRPRPTDLHAVVRGVVDEVAAAYPERTLTVVDEGDGKGTWDPDRLGQVVQNLVTNALKYSPPSTPVDVLTRPDNDGISLVVHNEGAPIPEEKIAVLFEPYQRAVSRADTLDRSIGLGLYIVKKIIDAHHGSIAVTSNEAGTTFTMTLPRDPGRR